MTVHAVVAGIPQVVAQRTRTIQTMRELPGKIMQTNPVTCRDGRRDRWRLSSEKVNGQPKTGLGAGQCSYRFGGSAMAFLETGHDMAEAHQRGWLMPDPGGP